MAISSSQNLIVEEKRNGMLVRFSCPEIRNPLSIEVLDELSSVLDRGISQKIIFTGTDDVFASGANLKEIALVTKDAARKFALRGQNLMDKIASAKQTTIAAVNGYCFGGALDLALSCDVRIATPNAIFCHPGANLGIMTGWGGTQRLPRLIGEAKALEIFMTARQVGAEEALQIGLIDRIVENLAAEIAELSENQ